METSWKQFLKIVICQKYSQKFCKKSFKQTSVVSSCSASRTLPSTVLTGEFFFRKYDAILLASLESLNKSSKQFSLTSDWLFEQWEEWLLHSQVLGLHVYSSLNDVALLLYPRLASRLVKIYSHLTRFQCHEPLSPYYIIHYLLSSYHLASTELSRSLYLFVFQHMLSVYVNYCR